MRILVSGSRGFVGCHLMERLRAVGHDAVALRRGGAAADRTAFAGPADLAAIDTFADWPEGIEAVVHLAAANPRRGTREARDLAALRRANVDATAALARRAAREGVRRMVFLGSAAVHAPNADRPVSEEDAFAPATPYAATKAEAENAFRQALKESETTGIVLRPAPVFGPGAGNLTAALARLARLPLPLPLEGLGAPRSLLSVDALVDAILLSLTADTGKSATFLLAEEEPLTPGGIVAALREGANRRPGLLPAPTRFLGFAGRRLGRGLVIDAALARDELGWRPERAAERLRAMAAQGRL